jgi:CIC family chloride channel protein
MKAQERPVKPVKALKAIASELSDFTADSRMLLLSALALFLGAAGAVLAWALLHLIYGATNMFYFHRWSWEYARPGANHLGWLALFVPIIGGLIVGVMARYGSDKIRGHGMPEAIESILMNGAKIHPNIAVLKPISAAIAIGSGGPFGAEGPIIMTAGSVGSLIGQLFRLSDAERTTLLVAGAAAGMSAVFATPLAAILLAVELLLFEWRPRSLVPVAVASTAAATLRRLLLGNGPLFPMRPMLTPPSANAVLVALGVGAVAGLLALVLSRGVYASEDLFEHLPIHWMWWPAIGGLVIGIGGLFFPPALGTGYDVIGGFVGGNLLWSTIAGVLIVKSIIWAFSLGSGTSGGILAPLLMIGGALGAAFTHVLPVMQPGAWPLVGMAAVLSGAIGCPLTAAVMSVELTHNYELLVPLLAASMAAHAVTALLQRRSILTERLSRRGYHLSREYGVDPLETMTVAQVMRTSVVVLPSDATPAQVRTWLTASKTSKDVGDAAARPELARPELARPELARPELARPELKKRRGQRLYPVVDSDARLLGVITRKQVRSFAEREDALLAGTAALEYQPARVTYTDVTLRKLAERMAAEQVYALPVLERGSEKLAGLIRLEDLLTARARSFDRETNLERVRRLRMPFRRVAALDAQREKVDV